MQKIFSSMSKVINDCWDQWDTEMPRYMRPEIEEVVQYVCYYDEVIDIVSIISSML